MRSSAIFIFCKTQAASIAGSFADFLITIVMVEGFHIWYVAGNFAGNICGAVTQFLLCRDWVFHSTNGKLSNQVLKYILVWVGNLLLSAAGVYLLTHFGGLKYLYSKIITSVLLGVSYNYLLMKRFVFS